MSVIDTALPALQAQSKKLAVSANNVANARSLGFLEAADGSNNGGFRPSRVEQTSLAGGGVVAREVAKSPASVLVYQPDDSHADAEGLVPRPNVNLAEEFVNQILAQRAYEASARLIAAEDRRLEELSNPIS